MSKPSSAKRGFLRRLLRDVEEHGEKKLELAGYDKLLGDPDYHQLKQLTTLDVHQMLRRYLSKLHHHLDDAHAEERLHQLALRLDRSALMREKRSRLLQAIRQTYNDFFHNYFITGDHCFRLRVS
ncbi:MAG: hypothetical protein MMC33_004264 [Icmadophila ericetorum]|nr:hypothetical protein [Icmadophila ericetorum]